MERAPQWPRRRSVIGAGAALAMLLVDLAMPPVARGQGVFMTIHVAGGAGRPLPLPADPCPQPDRGT